MKRYVLIPILMICLLLCACQAKPQEPSIAPKPTDSSGVTSPSDSSDTNPTQQTDPQETEPQPTDPPPTDPQETEPQPTDPPPTDPQETEPQPTDPPPTDPTATEPPDPNALTVEEIAELQEIYKYQRTQAEFFPYRFYNIALGQTYSDPREIDLYSFFHCGDYAEWTMTDEEFAFIKSAIRDAEYKDLFRATPENMDAILQMCFGLSLQDMQGNGLDSLAYFEETGCYYNGATAPPMSADSLEITGGTHLEDGNLQVYYKTNSGKFVMILKPVESGYHILSNLEVEK